jgi:Zn-dependent protease with chaperone function
VLAAVVGMVTLALVLEFVRRRALRLLVPDRKLHWTERARSSVELKGLAVALAVSVAVVTAIQARSWQSASGCSRHGLVALAVALVAMGLLFRALGAIDAAYQGVSATLGQRLRSVIALLLVVRPALLVTLLAVCSAGLAPRDGWIWLWVLAVAVAHCLASTGITYGLARRTGVLRPARPVVLRAVERACAVASIRPTSVDELALLMPNAFAFPIAGRIAFTVTAAGGLTEDELFGIALHELGHLDEPRLVRWLRPLGGLTLVPVAVSVPLLATERSLAFGLLCGFAFVLAISSTKASLRHEVAADAHARAHATDYARSLEALHRLGGIPATVSVRTTHPSLYDRMLAAGVTPSYPRPKAPRRFALAAVFLLIPLLLAATELGSVLARGLLIGLFPADQAAYAAVALRGNARDLAALSLQVRAGDPELGELLEQRSEEVDPIR